MTKKRKAPYQKRPAKAGGSADTLSVAEFKANAPRVMERVRALGKPVLVTRHGKPLVRIVPAAAAVPPDPIGWMRGTVISMDDIVSPDPDDADQAPDPIDGHGLR